MFQKALAFLTAMIVVSGFVILLVSSGVSHAQAGWQQWEYLLIEYTRNDVSIFDEDNPPLEYIQTSTEPYASDFQYILTGGCEDLQVESTAELIARLENEFAEMSNEERQSIIEVHEGLRQMEEIIQENECLARNYRGLTYYLSILGNDGWELVQVINRSDLNTYQIEMFFKRLKL